MCLELNTCAHSRTSIKRFVSSFSAAPFRCVGRMSHVKCHIGGEAKRSGRKWILYKELFRRCLTPKALTLRLEFIVERLILYVLNYNTKALLRFRLQPSLENSFHTQFATHLPSLAYMAQDYFRRHIESNPKCITIVTNCAMFCLN